MPVIGWMRISSPFWPYANLLMMSRMAAMSGVGSSAKSVASLISWVKATEV